MTLRVFRANAACTERLSLGFTAGTGGDLERLGRVV